MRKLLFVLVALFSFLSLSCEIGLGAAVDTDPPVLTIKNPPVASIIRDDFAITGTYSDDGKIADISVEIIRTDGKGESYAYNGIITQTKKNKSEGKYLIEIPAKTEAVTDGEYQAIVTAVDETGRKTVSSTTFKIDNTPPIMILQRPATDNSVTEENRIDTFGKIFSLSGQAADDNSIDHIEVIMYDENGEKLGTVKPTKKNLPSNISLDVLSWGNDEGNLYKYFYGSDIEGDKRKYYCEVEVYDSAQSYPKDGSKQKAEDKIGNHTKDFYLYSEFAESAIKNEKVNDLYAVLNGTSNRAADASSIKATLDSLRKNKGVFYLNPKNNPTYTLLGYASASAFTTFENSAITIDVTQGLDGVPLRNNTEHPLRLYFIPADNSGQAIPGAEKIYPDNVTISGSASYKISYTIDRKHAKNAAGDTVTYDYGNYIVGVEGEDSNGTPLISGCDSIYGYPIVISYSGEAPTLNVDYKINGIHQESNSINYYVPKFKPEVNPATPSEILLSGTIEVSNDQTPSLEVFVDNVLKYSTRSGAGAGVGSVSLTPNGYIYSFSNISVSFGADAESALHTIIVTANNGSDTNDKRSIWLDAAAPDIKIQDVSPIASIYEDDYESNDYGNEKATNYINGRIKVSVSFIDKISLDLENKKPSIEFIQNGVANEDISYYDIPSQIVEDKEFDISKLAEGPVTMRITAYDTAGNKAFVEKNYIVSKDSDKPCAFSLDKNTLRLNYSYDNIKLKLGLNVFNIGTQFTVDLRDDDGLKKCWFYSVKLDNDGNEIDSTKISSEKSISGFKNTITYSLPKNKEDAGYYKVWIEVIDSESAAETYESAPEYNKATIGPFYIQLASDSPIVTLKSNQYVTTKTAETDIVEGASKSPLKVEIKIDSPEGPFVVKRALITGNTQPPISSASFIQKENEDPIKSVSVTAGQSSVTVYDYLPVSGTDKDYSVRYFVTDSAGNDPGTSVLTYTIDSTKPSIKNINLYTGSTPVALNESKWYSSDTLTVELESDDDGSKVSTVEYWDGEDWTALSPKGGKYSKSVTFENGTNTLKLRSIDNTGNFTKVEKTVNVDITEPSFDVLENSSGSTGNIIYINKDYTDKENTDEALVIYGLYEDPQSGVKELSVKLGTTAPESASVTYYSGTEAFKNDLTFKAYNQNTNKSKIKYWRASFKKSQLEKLFKDADGKPVTSEKLSFSGSNYSDIAISTASLNYTVIKDLADAKLENISLNASDNKGIYKSVEDETVYYVKPEAGRTYTLSGIAKDTVSGVQKIICKIDGVEQNPAETAGWSFPVSFDGKTNGNTITVVLNVFDNANNKSSDYTYTIKVDTAEPVSVHDIDAKDKDLYFRIGDKPNDDKEEDVGGKYSNNTYGNASTMLIRGYYPDTTGGSGINKYYYIVFNNKEVTIDSSKDYINPTTHKEDPYLDGKDEEAGKIFFKSADTLKDYVIANKRDTFVPIAEEYKNVERNKADGTKTTESVLSNYKTTVRGFKQGKNFLVIVAEDNVGNTSIDYATIKGTKYYCYSLNVDNKLPAFEEFKTVPPEGGDPVANPPFSKVYLTNGSKTETIKFYIKDEDSGIELDASGLSLILGDETITPVADTSDDYTNITIAERDGNGKYLVTLKLGKNDLKKVTAYQTLLATITDKADNKSSPQTLGIINRDATAPEVEITSPEKNAEVNKTITVSGKATDANEVAKITLTAKCKSVTKTYTYEKDGSNNTISYKAGIWNAIIDTTQLDPSFTATGNELTLSVKAEDESGNETETAAELKCKINQSGDRPVITIGSSVDFSDDNEGEIWVKGSSTLYGSVQDDDGIADGGFKVLKKKAGASTFTDAKATYSGGSWNVKIGDDGSYVLKFEVTDKGKFVDASGELKATGTKFEAADLDENCTDAQLLATPVIRDDTGKDEGHPLGLAKDDYPGTLVPICLDTGSPTLVIEAINNWDRTDSKFDQNWVEDYNKSDFYLGGKKDTLYIKVRASDTSGLDETTPVCASFTGTMDVKSGNTTDVYKIESGTNDCSVEQIGTTDEFIITVKNYKTAGKVTDDTISTSDTKPFSGTLKITVSATDKAGQTTDKQFSRTIDNAKPIIKLTAPNAVASTEVVSGSVEGEALNPSVYFTLSKTNTQPAENSEYWKQEKFATLSYKIYFDGLDSETETHTDLFRTWLTKEPTLFTSSTDISNNIYTTLTDVWVWIKVEDVCGNVAYKSAKVVVDPQGNRPTVKISYPEKDNDRLGGTIRLMGSASDNIAARYVWIQLDIDGGGWGISDYNKLKTIQKSSTDTTPFYIFGQISQNKTLAEADITPSDSNISDIGIMVEVSGGAWNTSINAHGELIPSGNSNTVTMTVYATDNDTENDILKSVAVVRPFIVDKDSPYFVQSSLKLVNAAGHEQTYKEGMSVKGEWYLIGEVTDDGGINAISMKIGDDGNDDEKINVKDGKPSVTSGDYQFAPKEGDSKTYTFRIKVSEATGVGKTKFYLTAEENKENNPLPVTKEFIINYDNEKPEVAPQTDTSLFKISNTVKNSQGYYSLSSKAYERHDGDTGVERVAVFFTRTYSNGKTYVFDPMYKRGFTPEGGSDISKLETGTALVQDSGTDSDMLFWGSATATSIASSTLTLSADAASYVHAGGLAKVKGVVYRINSVNGDTVVLAGEPGDGSNVAVKFAVANVVDNTDAESKETNPSIDHANSAYNSTTGFGYGYCDKYVYDDGDKIMENLHKDDSKTWTWELYVNSKNISDGDVDIHYVVFDKAGNCTYDKVSGASVENNKPRLVSVAYSLDTNQNGGIDDDDTTVTKYPSGLTEKPGLYTQAYEATEAAPFTISNITVKGYMEVYPEVVGGNGNLSYRWKTKTSSDWTNESATLMAGNSDYDRFDFKDDYDYVKPDGELTTQTGTITHNTEWLLNHSGDNDEHFWISYEIFDRTDGKTLFVDTNKLCINITDINLQVWDKTAPTVTIAPFYWNSLTDNSVYTSKAAAQVKSVEDLEGHIELNGQLPTTTFKTTNTNGEYDRDDKVSGIIRLKGTVKDNIVITSLSLRIDGMTGISSSTKVANYNRATGKWMNAENTAEFQKIGTLASDGYEFDILKDTNTFDADNGHSVEWSLIWDTSKISHVVDNDISVVLTAEDDAKKAGHTANRTGSDTRRVDVVPYITKISTALDAAYRAKTSVFNRSATGSYPVRRGEKITLTGYNLKSGSTAPTVKIGADAAALTDAQKTASTKTGFEVNIPNDAKSGDLTVTVSYKNTSNATISIESLNNKTNETVEYNQEPNGMNNDVLTSTRKLKVWSFATVVSDKTVRYPTMRVAKNTDQTVAFAYDSGAESYKMYLSKTLTSGNNFTVDYSFSQWYDTGVAVDSVGNIYGVSQNGDSGGAGEMSNRNQNGDYSGYANSYFYGRNTKTSTGKYRQRVQYNNGSYFFSDDYAYEPEGMSYAAYSKGNKKRAIENAYDGSTFNSQRVVSPKIVTGTVTVSGKTTTTPVYLAYYDSSSDQVKFRYGTVTGSGYDSGFSGALANHDNSNYGSAGGYQVVAGKKSNSAPSNENGNNVGQAGEYVAIGIVPTTVKEGNGTAGTAVVAWYDASSQRLLLSYNTAPTSNESASQWGSNVKEIDNNFTGWYVDLVIDPDGGIHLAYYDSSAGDLKYAYLKNYSATPVVCKVDSYLSVGTNISIDVSSSKETVYKADGTTESRYVPHISYFMSAFTKTAYSVRTAYPYKLDSEGNFTDGAENDKFTGKWEVMTVPTSQNPLDFTVGIGIKNNDAGTGSSLLGYGTKTGLETALLQ